MVCTISCKAFRFFLANRRAPYCWKASVMPGVRVSNIFLELLCPYDHLAFLDTWSKSAASIVSAELAAGYFLVVPYSFDI